MTNHRDREPTDRDQPAWSAIVLRSLIVLCPLAAVGVTWLAANRTLPLVALLVALLSAACALHPNSHFGVLVVVAIAVQWLAIVRNHTTLWSLGAAAALTVFHAAVAAATVAPPTAPWTSPMRRRWFRRAVTLIAASTAMWMLAAAADAHQSSSGGVLFAPALLVLAAGAIWARTGPLVDGRR